MHRCPLPPRAGYVWMMGRMRGGCHWSGTAPAAEPAQALVTSPASSNTPSTSVPKKTSRSQLGDLCRPPIGSRHSSNARTATRNTAAILLWTWRLRASILSKGSTRPAHGGKLLPSIPNLGRLPCTGVVRIMRIKWPSAKKLPEAASPSLNK